MIHHRLCAAIAALSLLALACLAPASQPAAKNSPPDHAAAFRAYLRTMADDAWNALADQPRLFGDPAKPPTIATKIHTPAGKAMSELNAAYLLALGYTDPTNNTDDAALLGDLTIKFRLLNLLTSTKPAIAERAWPILRDNPTLARRLALNLSYDDNGENLCTVLDQLDARLHDKVADPDWAGVVAAICLVHDETLARPAMPQSRAVRIDPADVLEHFVKNRSKMVFDPCSMPVEALIYLVDLTITPDETAWALKSYAGNKTVGSLYDSITYDTAAFKDNKDKKIYATDAYSLINIKKVGGVCAEQAYFATQVGKAIGVPSVYIRASSDVTAHAYVGYLRAEGGSKSLWWDFSEGRYDEYEELIGAVTDPQTGRAISDSQLAMSASLFTDKQQDRDTARTLVIASGWIRGFADSERRHPDDPMWPLPLLADTPADLREALKPRIATPSAQHQLEYLRAAVKACPALPDAWLNAAALADASTMTNTDKADWTEALMSACGTRYPDFSLSVLVPIIRGVDDLKQQDKLWAWAVGKFRSREDLAARIRSAQIDALLSRGEHAKAWTLASSVIKSLPKHGTVLVTLLEQAETILAASGKPDAAAKSALDLYAQAFKRLPDPGKLSASAYMQSNFYRVGRRYTQLLAAGGNTKEADKVASRINRYSTDE